MKELRVMLCGHPIKETVVVRFSSILLSIYAIPFVCSNDEFIQLRLYWDEEWNGKINKIQFVKVEAMGFYFSISIVRLSLQQQQTMQCAMMTHESLLSDSKQQNNIDNECGTKRYHIAYFSHIFQLFKLHTT